jgi:hypothetical protein
VTTRALDASGSDGGAGSDRGRWQPLQQPAPALRGEDLALESLWHLICRSCGQQFTQRRTGRPRLYCERCAPSGSPAASSALWRAANPEKVAAYNDGRRAVPLAYRPSLCCWCGNPYERRRRKQAPTCSERCRQQYERQRVARQLLDEGRTTREVARVLGVSRRALDRLLAHPCPTPHRIRGQR